ncbi:MAG: hypothetical protein ACP5MK_03450 [Candidatus Micrarchaeia archaeon]
MSYFGYALITIGILVILFTFYLGYSMYNSIGYSLQAQPRATSQSNASINSTISSISNSINSVTSQVSSMGYIVIQILLLFLFASIGYKIADLGIKTNSAEAKSSGAPSDKKAK